MLEHFGNSIRSVAMRLNGPQRYEHWQQRQCMVVVTKLLPCSGLCRAIVPSMHAPHAYTCTCLLHSTAQHWHSEQNHRKKTQPNIVTFGSPGFLSPCTCPSLRSQERLLSAPPSSRAAAASCSPPSVGLNKGFPKLVAMVRGRLPGTWMGGCVLIDSKEASCCPIFT